jgi:hypothetical protein
MVNLCFQLVALQFAAVVLLQTVAAWAEAPRAVPAAGEPFEAEVAAVDANWQITFRAGQRQGQMAAAELVCWGRLVEQGRGAQLVLADGSVLAAEVVAADQEQLTADSDLLGTLHLPLKAISGVVIRPPPDRRDRDALLDRLAKATGDTDRLLLDNGDELSGLVVGIANDAVKLKTDVGTVDVKLDRVGAIVFNPTLKQMAAKIGPLRAWVGLSDGSRLLATQLAVEGDAMRITAAGQTFSAKRRGLVFLQPLGGRVVYLSDLKPAEYHQTPYLDLAWPWLADRNVSGGFLRCGGRPYLKGIGVHSEARLEYELDQPWRRFEAEVGVDDATERRGSVQFRVLVDGREKFASAIVRGGDPPLPVAVDVTGAKKLELVVEYGDRADVLDWANWLNARLVK